MAVPYTTNLVAHWDANDLAYEDDADVVTWLDKTASDYDLTGGASKPSMEVDSLNGNPGVVFNTSNVMTNASFTTDDNHTHIAVVTNFKAPLSAGIVYMTFQGSTEIFYRHGTVAGYHGFGTLVNGGWHMNFVDESIDGVGVLYTLHSHDTAGFIRLNRTQVSTATYDSRANSNWQFGWGSNNQSPNFKIHEWLTYNEVMTAENYEAVEDWLYAKWLGTPPTVPTALSADSTSGSSMLFSWTDNSDDEDGFLIEKSLDDAAWETVITTAADATSYELTGLDTGVLVYVRATATSAAEGNSDPSSSVSGTPAVGYPIAKKTSSLAGMSLSRRGIVPDPPGKTDRIRRNKRLSDT